MSNIFVTGADGFIGSHLVEYLLKKNYKVTALSQYNSFGTNGWLDHFEKKYKNLDILSGDIRDINSFKNVFLKSDYVFHLAALISIPYSYSSYQSYVETNINGTLNVLELAKTSKKLKKIIVTSTSEVYGTAEYVPIDENHHLNAQSPYAATKIAADQLSLSFHKSFNVPVVIVRPFNTFGPRQSSRAVIPTIINQFINFNGYIDIGEVQSTRDFTYVEELAEGFYLSMINKKNIGSLYNLGSNFEISIKDLILLIAEIFNKRNYKIRIQKKKLRPKKSEVYRLWCDNSKSKKILKWSPKYNSLKLFKKPLTKTIDWYKNNNPNIINFDHI